MPYSVHNFTPGQRARAEDINDMDAQIYENTVRSEANETFIDGIDNYLVGKLNSNLSLSVDSDTLYLMYGNIMLSSVSLPMDLDDYVPCTGVSINNKPAEGALTVYVDGSSIFAATKTPADTTQNLRWSVDDIDIATVYSTGRVEFNKIGRCNLVARCGSYSDTLNILIKKKLATHSSMSLCNWLSQSGSTITFVAEGTTMIGTLPMQISDYTVPSGCTITFEMSDSVDVNFANIVVFKAAEGQTITPVDSREDNDRYYINNVTVLATASQIHNKTQNQQGQWGFWENTSYSYVNNTGGDVYVAFSCQDLTGSTWGTATDKLARAREVIAQYMNVVISPSLG